MKITNVEIIIFSAPAVVVSIGTVETGAGVVVVETGAVVVEGASVTCGKTTFSLNQTEIVGTLSSTQVILVFAVLK